jgi:hypothetical protein
MPPGSVHTPVRVGPGETVTGPHPLRAVLLGDGLGQGAIVGSLVVDVRYWTPPSALGIRVWKSISATKAGRTVIRAIRVPG